MTRSTRKPDPNQPYLDFDTPNLEKHEKRMLIRAVKLERVRRDRPSATPAQWRNGQVLLQYFVSLDRWPETVPGITAIAKANEMSPATVKRTIAFLVDLGVLIVLDRGPKSNRYIIDFRRLATVGANVGSKRSDNRADLSPQTGENEPTKTAPIGINLFKPNLTSREKQNDFGRRRRRRADPRRGFQY